MLYYRVNNQQVLIFTHSMVFKSIIIDIVDIKNYINSHC